MLLGVNIFGFKQMEYIFQSGTLDEDNRNMVAACKMVNSSFFFFYAKENFALIQKKNYAISLEVDISAYFLLTEIIEKNNISTIKLSVDKTISNYNKKSGI